VELKNKDDWIKINAGQHTLMRVLYTPEMMKRLEGGVRDRTLTPEVRGETTRVLSDGGLFAEGCPARPARMTRTIDPG